MQAEKVYNQDLYFKKAVKFVGEPMSHMESIASSAVRIYEIFLYFFFSLIFFQSVSALSYKNTCFIFSFFL